ncbi:Hypothetical_protein [Hexamita inflata]|uniref:Hypothetical_protein n=1 Tax=Hexamita inflata TaxID=28002 RepID=A0ABP1GH70_9EUKA
MIGPFNPYYAIHVLPNIKSFEYNLNNENQRNLVFHLEQMRTEALAQEFQIETELNEMKNWKRNSENSNIVQCVIIQSQIQSTNSILLNFQSNVNAVKFQANNVLLTFQLLFSLKVQFKICIESIDYI